ncbi:MAG: radical SAM protein [Oscillospiraceae bacterium]
MKQYTIPIFIPHEGCPHDCTFCNQRKITGVSTSVTPDDAEKLIFEGLKRLDTNSREHFTEVAYFGGSFTGLEVSLQEDFLRVAEKYADKIHGIRLSTRPDYINDEIIELLKKYKVTTVELGAQSADDEVLRVNNRGHLFEDVIKSSKMIKDAGIELGLQMMIGMYGSTPEKDILTAEKIASLLPKCTRIYPTITLKDTELENLYRCGKYIPYDVEKAVKVTAKVLRIFRNNNIEVIRIGLHSSDDLRREGNIVAGPFHAAFGELVEGEIYRENIEREIIDGNYKNCEYIIHAKPCEVSKIIGQNKRNKKYFYEKFGVNLVVKQ